MIDLGHRRTHLCKHVPRCPACSGLDNLGILQVQLVQWTDRDRHGRPKPATWKCRMCKMTWNYEPPAGLVVDSSPH